MSQEVNPYIPPQSEVSEEPIQRELKFASRGRRFGTFIVDYLGYVLFGMMIGGLIGVVFGAAGLHAIQSVPSFLFGLPIVIAYYLIFEGLLGRTPGKFVFGTAVVDEEGSSPSFKQVLGRTLARFIPFEAFSFLGKRGWHDSLSGTHVVVVR